MKVFVGVSAIVVVLMSLFADFSIGHDFGQGEVICLVWLANFMIACIAAIMES